MSFSAGARSETISVITYFVWGQPLVSHYLEMLGHARLDLTRRAGRCGCNRHIRNHMICRSPSSQTKQAKRYPFIQATLYRQTSPGRSKRSETRSILLMTLQLRSHPFVPDFNSFTVGRQSLPGRIPRHPLVKGNSINPRCYEYELSISSS